MAHQLTLNSTSLEELKTLAAALPDEKKIQESKSVTPTTAAQTVTPDSGYDGVAKVTVSAMPTGALSDPTIDFDTPSGGIYAYSEISKSGYIDDNTRTAAFLQLTVQAAQTITPGTSNKTIASGRYLTGTQTIKGDANLIAANIKKGTSIFGVTGTLEATASLPSAESATF